MPDPERYVRDATGGSGIWSDPTVPSRDDFIAYQLEIADQAVILVNDESELPGDANIRANGVFTDAEDLIDYLERGGLVIPTGTGPPTYYEPVGFVYAVFKQLADGTYEYQVYIRDDSD